MKSIKNLDGWLDGWIEKMIRNEARKNYIHMSVDYNF